MERNPRTDSDMICLFVSSVLRLEKRRSHNLSIKNNIVEYSEENIISQFFFGGMNRLMILQFHMKEKNNEFLGGNVSKRFIPPPKKIKDASPKKQPNRVFFKKLKGPFVFFPLITFPEKTIENPPHQPCHHPNSDCLHRADAASS